MELTAVGPIMEAFAHMLNRYRHQQREYDLFRSAKSRALLWSMRTGKSKAALDCAQHLHQCLEIGGVLIVAPNGLHVQWVNFMLRKHCDISYSGFAFRLSEFKHWEKFENWIRTYDDSRMFVMAVNMESIIRDEVIRAMRLFKSKTGPALLIVDESHHFARPSAKRTKLIMSMGRAFEYKRILTGTESEDSPLQSYSQFEILQQGALGHRTYTSFKNYYGKWAMERYGSKRFPKLVGYQNLDEMKKLKAKFATVVLREDCEDLPPVIEDARYIEMTSKQRQYWQGVKQREMATLEALGRFDPLAGGAALIELQTVEGVLCKAYSGDMQNI